MNTENTGAASAVPSLDTDLATLREACEGWPQPNVYDAALDRVEAEIARLRQEREKWFGIADDLALKTVPYLTERYQAAERELAAMSRRNEWLAAKVARLREGLRQIAERERWVQAGPLIDEARALLAEDAPKPALPLFESGDPDFAARADRLAEDGAAQPEDTPFTAPAVQSHERGLFERRKDGAA